MEARNESLDSCTLWDEIPQCFWGNYWTQHIYFHFFVNLFFTGQLIINWIQEAGMNIALLQRSMSISPVSKPKWHFCFTPDSLRDLGKASKEVASAIMESSCKGFEWNLIPNQLFFTGALKEFFWMTTFPLFFSIVLCELSRKKWHVLRFFWTLKILPSIFIKSISFLLIYKLINFIKTQKGIRTTSAYKSSDTCHHVTRLSLF